MNPGISIRLSTVLRLETREEKQAFYAHLAQAVDDERLGRVQDADEAFRDILEELERME